MARDIKRLPSLNGLRVFEVVSRHLNFRMAAEELGVTQGAVAQQIRGLEAELGLKLFERHPKTLALSEAGREYVANIRRAFELISEATETLRPESHPLTISVTPTFASKWLIPRLPDFTAAHPDIDIRILASDRLSNFQSDGVDIAVRYGRPPFGSGLNAELLVEETIVAVASPLLVEKLGNPEQGENLIKYALLHDSHNFWPQFLDSVFSEPAALSAKNIRFNQTSLAIDAAIAGQGLALASAFFVKEDIDCGRLSQIFKLAFSSGSNFYLVTVRKPRNPGPVAAVSRWLKRAATKN